MDLHKRRCDKGVVVVCDDNVFFGEGLGLCAFGCLNKYDATEVIRHICMFIFINEWFI